MADLISFEPVSTTESFDLGQWWSSTWGSAPAQDTEFGNLDTSQGTGKEEGDLSALLANNDVEQTDVGSSSDPVDNSQAGLDYLSQPSQVNDFSSLNANSLESKGIPTGKDAVDQRKTTEPKTDKSDWSGLLNSKVGQAVAGQLVSGLLGGVGQAQLLKERQKMDKELMDYKYQQQLDYQQRTAPAKIQRKEWKPILSNGILGAAK